MNLGNDKQGGERRIVSASIESLSLIDKRNRVFLAAFRWCKDG